MPEQPTSRVSGEPGAGPPASLLTLHRLPRGYRVLYTGLLLFVLLALGAGLLQQALRAGLSPLGAAEWILGNADREDAARLLFSREPHEVLDEMWRRSLAAILPGIVLAALVFRTSAPGRVRGPLIAGIGLFALLEVLGPGLVWLAGTKALGWVWFVGQLGLAAAALVGVGLCLRDIWLRSGGGPRFRPGGRPEEGR